MSSIRIWPEIPMAVLLLAVAGPRAIAADVARPEARHPSAGSVCEGAIQHPLRITATTLDPVRRGEIVRIQVTTTATRDMNRGEVRLTHTGGATRTSPARAPLGRLAAGRSAAHEFAVRIPAEGHRFLVQFRVTGEGREGIESRGATLNLLPDGPADPGRVVHDGAGGQVTEYRAKRIDR